jgi:YVTN family beta-propeller protein
MIRITSMPNMIASLPTFAAALLALGFSAAPAQAGPNRTFVSGNNSNGNGAAWARGFAALWAVLAIGLGLAAFPAEAQPFAYVANGGSDTVSVIDTATKMVVATVGVGMVPDGVAVMPNGQHVYVANASSNTVSVIHAATNTVGGCRSGWGLTP